MRRVHLPRAIGFGLLMLLLCFPLGLPNRESAGLPPLLTALLVALAVLAGGLWPQHNAEPLPWRRWLKSSTFWLLPALCLIWPLLPVGNLYILDALTIIFIITLGAIGLNITVGQTGLMNTGFAGLYAVGAYTSALMSQNLGLGFWVSLLPSILMGAGAGALMAVPVLRLRGDYLAVVTLGFAEIFRITLINADHITNGAAGIIGIRKPDFFGLAVFAPFSKYGLPTFASYMGVPFSPAQQKIFFYYVALFFLALGAAAVYWLRRSAIGRRLEALREDPIACDSLGLNRGQLTITAFACSGALGGLAGCLFAARQGFVNPESFTFNDSVLFLAVAVLGGNNALALLPAACLAIGLPEVFRDLAAWRMPIFGLALVAITLLCPKGLSGARQPSIRFKGGKV